jgi:TolB protein
VLARTDRHLDAPNWSPDGNWLVINADGCSTGPTQPNRSGPGLVPVPTGNLDNVHNDHVISPDGAPTICLVQ